MHTLHYKYDNVLIYINTYTFWASLAHHRGLHSWTKQLLDLIIVFSMRNWRNFIHVWFIEMDVCTSNTLKPTGCSIYYAHILLCKSHIDELVKVPHIGDDNKV